jgi:hypothetical protein
MKDNEDNKWGDWNPVTMMRAAVLALMVCLFIALLCAGCSPRVVETVVVRTDTLIQTKVEKDSVVKKDSVYVHEWMAGDTVYMEKVKWMERWRDRLLTDTLYISKRDTVKVKDVVVKEVKKPMGWFSETFMIIGIVASLSLIVFIVWKIRKYLG